MQRTIQKHSACFFGQIETLDVCPLQCTPVFEVEELLEYAYF